MRRPSGPAIAVIVLLTLVVVPALYPLSSGPVLAIGWNTRLGGAGVFKFYEPLFRFAPKLSTQYAQLCGVPDIVIFFLLSDEQTGVGFRRTPTVLP